MAERRERDREQLRAQIIDAARDLLVEQGLAGLSMRAIAERIEYSPATLYLYFRHKDELVREVVETGFQRLKATAEAELARVPAGSGSAVQYGAMGRAYARFAIENPAYFRVMFELPGTAEFECRQEADAPDPEGFELAVALVERAVRTGEFGAVDPRRAAVIGWGVIHGLTALYLSGHLRHEVTVPEDFYELIETAMSSLYTGWRPDGPARGDG